MNISWEWLTEIIDLNNIQPEYLSERLTLAGFEVEGISRNNCNDIVLEISTTANRGDILGIMGLAREISAIMERPLISPKSRIPLKIRHQHVENKHSKCSHYIYGIITGLKSKSTPEWLKRRLIANHVKPINVLEDIQHFIYLKWAQHIDLFDLDSLGLEHYDDLHNSLKIVSGIESRPLITKEGELISEIKSNILSIQANDKPLAIAGITTNAEYITNKETTNILLQISKFNVESVNTASENLKICTNNSTSHKKDLGTIDLLNAYSESIFLITSLCLGHIDDTYYFHCNKYIYPYTQLMTQKIVSTLGLGIINNDDHKSQDLQSLQNLSVKILKKLRFIIWRYPQYIIVETPMDRIKDVSRSIDLIEEISRIYGFDKFTGKIPSSKEYGTKQQKHNRINHLRSVLRTAGLSEVIHSSLVENKYMEPIVCNPIVKEYNSIRSSLLGNLINTHSYNLQQGNSALEIFEVGKVIHCKNGQYEEKIHVAGIIGKGINIRSKWQDTLRGLSWFEAKGIMEEVFERIGTSVQWEPLNRSFDLYEELGEYFSKTSTSTLYSQDESIGLFGTIQFPEFKLYMPNTTIYGFEISIDKVAYKSISTNYFISYTKYPAITRDITVTIPNQFNFQTVIDQVNSIKDPMVESVDLLNFYRNQQEKSHLRRLGFRIKYRSSSGTLASTTIDRVESNLKNIINSKFSS